MPIRVKERATGKVVEVPSAVAMRGLGTEFDLADPRVRVIGPDGRTGTAPSEKIQAVIGAGYKLADNEEVAQQRQTNEAHTAVGTARGLGEQFASGLTLGASDLVMEGLGADPAGMRAREEALGGVGTAARIAGEVAPALLTGGGSLGARGAARFLPGVALERAAADIGGRSLAVRGAVEGLGYGLGQQVHESVLGETPLQAEHLLAGGFTGMALGGAAGAALGGIGRGLGAAVRDGSSKLAGSAEELLTRLDADGLPPSKLFAEAVAKGDNSMMERWLRANGTPEDAARRLAGEFAADVPRFQRALSEGPRLDEELAVLVRDELGPFQSTLDDALEAVEGAAKYRQAAGLIPRETSEQALERSAAEIDSIVNDLDALAEENARKSHQLYDVGKLDTASEFARRAQAELYESPKPEVAFEALDKLKRDLGTLKIFGDPGPMAPSGIGKANERLRGIYKRVQGHLEMEDLWGPMAVRQADINRAASQDFAAQASFKAEHGRGKLGQLWDPVTGEVNGSVARRVARHYGRGSPLQGNRLAEVLEARVQRLEAYAQHTELPPDLRKAVSEMRARKTKIEDALRERSELAAITDDMQKYVRAPEGGGSPSLTMLSTLGPVLGGTIGSAFGPLGTAAGIALGGLTRPYSTLRGLAGILSFTDKAVKRIDVAMLRTRAKLLGERVAGATRAAARGVRKGATAAATHTDDERQKTMQRVRMLARDPEALANALDVPGYELRKHAPNLERIAAQKIHTAAAYLVSQEPAITTTPFGAEMVDPVKEREFKQCYEATLDPLAVLELIPEGRFTSKHGHALQTVYPEIWAGVQQIVWETFVEARGRKRKVPLDIVSGVGITLGIPTDVGLKPGMATELAMRYSGVVPGLTPPPSPGAPGSSRPRKARAGDIKRTINTYKTPLERASTE